MTTALLPALVLGLAGGLHCAGMCGPLVLAFGSQQSRWQLHGMYHAGRIAAYILLGQLMALVGVGLRLVGLQQAISITAGVLMLLLLLVHVNAIPHPQLYHWIGARVRQGFLQMSGQGGWRMPALGFLNGLLPCGLVYVAVAASLAAGSQLGSGLFMAVFGISTLPVLLGLGLLPGWRVLRPAVSRVNHWLPYVGMAMAVVLIVRGVGLPADRPTSSKMPATATAALKPGQPGYKCPMCR